MFIKESWKKMHQFPQNNNQQKNKNTFLLLKIIRTIINE